MLALAICERQDGWHGARRGSGATRASNLSGADERASRGPGGATDPGPGAASSRAKAAQTRPQGGGFCGSSQQGPEPPRQLQEKGFDLLNNIKAMRLGLLWVDSEEKLLQEFNLRIQRHSLLAQGMSVLARR